MTIIQNTYLGGKMKQKIFVSILTLLLAGGTLTGFSAKSNISQNDATNGNVPQVINEAIFQQNGITQQTSYDGGDTWNAAPVIEMPEFYSYDEFEEWIKNETVNLQELVAAGEISQSEVNAIIAQYETILSEIKDGVQISKRTSYEEEQLYFSLPNNSESESFQTVLYDGNSYHNFGPYDTKAELYAALEKYTSEQVELGNMTENEVNTILSKYK